MTPDCKTTQAVQAYATTNAVPPDAQAISADHGCLTVIESTPLVILVGILKAGILAE